MLSSLALGWVANGPAPRSAVRSQRSVRMADALTQDELKKMVGYKAVDDYVKSGMVIGLGTGSTAAFAVERVGMLLKSGELKDIVAIPTSVRTKEQAEELGTLAALTCGHSVAPPCRGRATGCACRPPPAPPTPPLLHVPEAQRSLPRPRSLACRRRQKSFGAPPSHHGRYGTEGIRTTTAATPDHHGGCG
jgi:hypothetical protein